MSKVSIIIATYNRAHYILDTLRSIQNQIFTDWECIVVDDGSQDETTSIVSGFIKDDLRFSYKVRPDHTTKGANACRNHGYSLSNGGLIKFFDSDDLMLPDHLEVLVNTIEEENLDFAVGDCVNFDESGLSRRPYEIDRSKAELSPKNFALFKTAWLTNDLLIKREFADQLLFAEGIRDQASEYQYNIKLLLLTTQGSLVDQILTHRRIHDDGFVVKAKKDAVWFDQMNAELKFVTMLYLEGVAGKSLQRWFLSGHIQLNFKLVCQKRKPQYVWAVMPFLSKYYSLRKAVLYPFTLVVGYFLNSGYSLIKYIREHNTNEWYPKRRAQNLKFPLWFFTERKTTQSLHTTMLFTIKKYIHHLLRSTNQHGVHSPFIFEFVTKCLYDNKQYPVYDRLRDYRNSICEDHRIVEVKDFGAGSNIFKSDRREVSQIGKYAGASLKRMKLLYRATGYFKPIIVLELGTSVGLATAAMASGFLDTFNANRVLDTVEGCTQTLRVSKEKLALLEFDTIRFYNQEFDRFFAENARKTYDLIYFDGNHGKQATLNYFTVLLPTATNESVWIFDDIYWSTAMGEAWEAIKKHPSVTVTVDCFWIAFVFFRQEQAKEHFKIRI